MDDQTAREMARDLVRGSIIEDAAAQFIAQVLKHTHDSRIKPLQKRIEALEESDAREARLEARIEELEAKLAKAVAQMQRVKDFRYDPNIGIELNLLEATLAELKGDTP